MTLTATTMILGACRELILPRLFHPGPRAPQVEVTPGFVDDRVSTVMNGIAPKP